MLLRIISGIVLGAVFGYMTFMMFAGAGYASESLLVLSTLFGVISGLLICVIVEINNLTAELRKQQ
ncbi:hypothetical protein LCL89_04205 [Halobacillus yeomjeoni]|uniref:hypothetical protein n=1 Tax=Halobacillus yeomjeoni TaxID=311194 RepID=UPI001CD2928A|nr:hypothetical protein [Halobacillus yeomjeoni]MCA0983251.1 hypothetical protein [Halobacillus yeomjeoni]